MTDQQIRAVARLEGQSAGALALLIAFVLAAALSWVTYTEAIERIEAFEARVSACEKQK